MADVIQEWSEKPFAYGTADCCQFAGALVEAFHGYNPMARFAYSDEADAQGILDAYGSLGAAMRSVLGEPIPVDSAMDGDALLLVDKAGREFAGVVVDGKAAIRLKEQPRLVDLGMARLAWAT